MYLQVHKAQAQERTGGRHYALVTSDEYHILDGLDLPSDKVLNNPNMWDRYRQADFDKEFISGFDNLYVSRRCAEMILKHGHSRWATTYVRAGVIKRLKKYPKGRRLLEEHGVINFSSVDILGMELTQE